MAADFDDDPARRGSLRTLADYERAALPSMSEQARSYIEGGAGDEITLRDNADAWQRLALRPRVLTGVGHCDLRTRLLGVMRPHPVVIAPTAFQRLVHPQAEIGVAKAAAATDTIMCVSTLSSTGAAAVAAAIPGQARWFQLYAFVDRGVTRELIQSAAAHGYEALVVTVDRPVLGLREREWSSNVRDVSRHGPTEAPAAAGGTSPGTPPADYSTLIDPDLRWSDIELFAAESPLPVLVKGIMAAQDAQLAIEHGAQAVIVSNHGGRQLDTVLSGADALAPIVDAVAGRIDVLVDGGIRRGTDVVKALALGAGAVLVGRPLTWGLAVGGAEGAQRVIEILLAEVHNALALSGCPRVTDLDRSFVAPAPWAGQAGSH
jgi:isopentenyl diphosphate isomerase/L-lactate dehydrogenase-like FMN-dependent dehydrogenase